MKSVIEKSPVEQVNLFDFISFSLCYYYYYFSNGFFCLFYKRIRHFFSNENFRRPCMLQC